MSLSLTINNLTGKFSKTSRDSAIVSHVLEKIRVPIISHWNLLKKKLRYLDPMGTSRVEKVGTLCGEVSRDAMGTSRVEKVGTLCGEVLCNMVGTS